MADFSLQADSAGAIPVSRRAMLACASAAAALAVVPAAIAAEAPDAAILRAWETRRATFERYNALPFGETPDGDIMTPAERECWAIIDVAEDEIQAAVARTPLGAEIQCWLVLDHSVLGRADSSAVLRRDLGHFEAQGRDPDWNVLVLIAALRSLKAMGA